MLTDTDGGIREQYDYDAFGMPYFYNARGDRLGGANRWGNRFLFTGREWLQDLKVYDYRNRIYQPELGRFLQPDPKEFEAGDYNLYRYCHNDPVNKSDPTGLSVTSDIWNDQMRFQGNSPYSSTVDRELRQLHADGYVTVAQISYAKPTGQAAPTVTDFAGFYKAAQTTFNEIERQVAKFKTEYFSRIQKNDDTGKRIVGKVTVGNGVKGFSDEIASGRAETSGIDKGHLATGYRVEGFVLGHRFYDPQYMQNDMKRAAKHGWHAIFITPPMRGVRAIPAGTQIIPYDYTQPEPILTPH